jgi:hypothetical protein
MPNARDAHATSAHKILILGDTGSGKTTQILTLPGRTFAYLFDPNAILSLQGSDIEYEEFLPDKLNLAMSSLTKGKGDAGKPGLVSNLYNEWERDFTNRLNSGYFEDFDNIAFDSATTFLDLAMDRVLSINGRFGQWPQQDDYGPQMISFLNVCRSLTGTGKTILMTGHMETYQDKLTSRVFRGPLMTGKLKTKIPLLFSDIFVADCETSGDTVNHRIQTTKDRLTSCVRTSFKGLASFEDVTLDFEQPLQGQGIGRLILEERERNKV